MAKYMMLSLKINVPGESVISYIERGYPRLLDYAKFHSDRAGIPELANDLLNEVLLNVLQKDRELLDKLYSTKKGQYTELDFYLLRLIKINAYSLQSPFRWKYRNANIDTGVNWQRLKIIDELPVDEVDKSEILLKEFRLVVWVFRSLDLTEFERAVFEHHFINDESFIDWPGPENYRKVNSTYHQIIGTIRNIFYFLDLTKVIPKGKLSSRQSELCDRFVKAHRIKKTNKSLVNI